MNTGTFRAATARLLNFRVINSSTGEEKKRGNYKSGSEKGNAR